MQKVHGLVLLFAAAIGCSGGAAEDLPDLARVTGTVTLDGQPLAGANISFEPQGEGALSVGGTDENGRYELLYSPGVEGAVLGAHTVRISKRETEGGPEVIPSQYNDATTLSAEVKAGENTIDFALEMR